jgi:hypothetical protein
VVSVRVLFTGSRHLDVNRPDHRMPIYQALRHIDTTHPGPHILVHGDADGGDQIAKQAAGFLGWATDPHPADWNWAVPRHLPARAPQNSTGRR